VNYIRTAAQLSDGFNNSPGKENSPFVIVLVLVAGSIGHSVLALEIIIVVDEIDLHACTLNGSYLYDEGMVGIINYQIHPGKADNLMKLVSSLVNGAITGHECPDLLPPFLYALWQITADL